MIDSELRALTRLAVANQHGPLGTPESLANLVQAQMLASIEMCDRCEVLTTTTPAAQQRWVVEQVHELDCPKCDDAPW